MGEHLHKSMEKTALSAVKALKKNNIDAIYLENEAQLLPTLKEMMPVGSSCSVGGSVTLMETGVLDFLKSGDYTYYDRYAPDANVNEVFANALGCDFYLTSTNALTLKGELFNIDGRGNRLAAICWGPKRVIMITGYNKIVTDLHTARERLDTIATPANAIRLNCKTPCATTGYCSDCSSPERLCCQELVTSFQRPGGRISVIILGGSYGF